jgi:hypothetical protein
MSRGDRQFCDGDGALLELDFELTGDIGKEADVGGLAGSHFSR